MSERFAPTGRKPNGRRQVTIDMEGAEYDDLYNWIHRGAALLNISRGSFMRQALEFARLNTEEPE